MSLSEIVEQSVWICSEWAYPDSHLDNQQDTIFTSHVESSAVACDKYRRTGSSVSAQSQQSEEIKPTFKFMTRSGKCDGIVIHHQLVNSGGDEASMT